MSSIGEAFEKWTQGKSTGYYNLTKEDLAWIEREHEKRVIRAKIEVLKYVKNVKICGKKIQKVNDVDIIQLMIESLTASLKAVQ